MKKLTRNLHKDSNTKAKSNNSVTPENNSDDEHKSSNHSFLYSENDHEGIINQI